MKKHFDYKIVEHSLVDAYVIKKAIKNRWVVVSIAKTKEDANLLLQEFIGFTGTMQLHA